MVTLLNQGPYGQALFGLGMEGKRAAGYDPLNSVSPAVTARLMLGPPAQARGPAEAQAFALAMAAKGLFVSAQSAEDFRSAMIRVLEGHGLFPTPRP